MRVRFPSLLVFLCLGVPSAFAQNGFKLSTDEAQFVKLINQFRASLNLPTLTLEYRLESAAKKHSDDQAANQTLSHSGPLPNMTPWDRMKAEGYVNYSYAGENVACGNGDAAKTFQQWALSPGHLLNMLNPHYHQMGIARAGTGLEMCPYFWTNDFGSLSNGTQDPPSPDDLQTISQAVVAVSGPLPFGKSISLTETDEDGDAPAPTPVPTPVVASTPRPTVNSSTPKPGSFQGAIQCSVPNLLGMNVLTFNDSLDTNVLATPNSLGSYDLKLSYLQNGAQSEFYPVYVNGVVVIRNKDFPLVTILSTSSGRVNAFSIQINTKTGVGQFDSLSASPAASGMVNCTEL